MANRIKRRIGVPAACAILLGAVIFAISPAATAQEQGQVQESAPSEAQQPTQPRPFEIYARCLATTEVFLMDTNMATRLRRDLDVPPRRRLNELVGLFTGALDSAEGSAEEKASYLATIRTSFANVMSGLGAVMFMPEAHRALVGPCSNLAERIEQQNRDRNG